MATAGIVSYRLLGTDGVSIEAEKWARALEKLGFEITRVAGSGPPELVTHVRGLDRDDTEDVDRDALEAALSSCDLVIVENLCSLPLNPRAGDAVAQVLAGRPAVLRHHDLAWQRPDTASFGPPPDDPAWRHVTINQISVSQLRSHEIDAVCLYNRFDLDPPPGDRAATRDALGLAVDDLLVLQPTRAIPRKNVPAGLALAQALTAAYWLTGAVEDGYEPTLTPLLAEAPCRIVRGQGPGSIHDAYAASDVVVLPSTWEGFGNPAVESVAHRRPLAIGPYPVADELRQVGFEYFALDEVAALLEADTRCDEGRHEHNLAVARAHFDIHDLPDDIARVIAPFT